MAAVPLLILFDSESPDQSLNDQAWAAAFVLMIFVLVLSLTARYILSRREREAARAVSSAVTRSSPNRHGGYAHVARRRRRDWRAEAPPKLKPRREKVANEFECHEAHRVGCWSRPR